MTRLWQQAAVPVSNYVAFVNPVTLAVVVADDFGPGDRLVALSQGLVIVPLHDCEVDGWCQFAHWSEAELREAFGK